MIRIAGAGIAGLSAGITLAKAGEKVTVYEKNKAVGERYKGDLQGIENWTSQKDALERLEEIGIGTGFPHKAVYKSTFYSPRLKEYELRTSRPTYYLVQRGSWKGCIDHALLEQAEEAGVKVVFGKMGNSCDIRATGPKNNAFGIGVGLTFKTKAKDGVFAILNEEIAPKAYAYLEIWKGSGCVVTIMPSDTRDKGRYLDKAIAEFRKITDFDMKKQKKFAGVGSFAIPDTAKEGGALLVGEAAGFQDFLLGFGMRYAFESGHLAAKSMLEGEDYDELWKKSFLGLLKASLSNRWLFERAGNREYRLLLRLLGRKQDVWADLHWQYEFGLLKRAIFPLAKRELENRTKDIKREEIKGQS